MFKVYEPCFTAGCTVVPFHVDTTVIGFFDPVAATFGVSSNVTFPFGLNWTAYDGTLFGPGTYTFSTINTATDVTITVNPGEIGGHILWSSTTTSDIFLKWDAEGTSLDFVEDLDGIPGYRQVDGTVPNFSLSFDLSQQPYIVPLPAAVWLFGSGLLGLVGMARRKNKN